jgi:Fe-S-cluster-containing hydrogenase component 2
VKPRGLLQRLLAFGKVEDPQVAASRDDGERHVPASYPIKCDMCDGLPFMGCVHACPTGAAVRVDPVDMHGEGVVGSVVRNAAAGGIS